jgi:acyl-coenzyme A synthetase/AMP-(fatty) acid ligase
MVSFLGLRPSSAPAVIDPAGVETLSFHDLLVRGADVADRLGRDRQLLFVLAANDALTAVTYAGAMVAGHAVALIDDSAGPDAMAALVATYEAGWVAGPPGTGVVLADHGVEVETSIVLDGGELVRTALGRDLLLHPSLSLLLTTSGSTGSRKFVRLSTANLESNAASIARYLGLTARERPITSLPIHYSFGLSVLDSHWLVGAPVVMTRESVMQRSFWEAFERMGCTSLAGVPYTFQMLERVAFRTMGLPSLSSLQQAGGALDRRLTELYAEHMRDRGGRLFVMYGQTEATARIAFVPPERLADKIGSAGVAIPGGRLRIDADGPEPPPAGATGEVVYEGPNVMLGYAEEAADLRRGDERGGVLRTGDLGYLDEDGYLFLVGRSKRIAKVHGRRINLDEIEALVREEGPAAVVGAEDAIVVAFAFGTADMAEDVAARLARRLAVHRSTVKARWVPAIPTSSSGKIDYEEVRRWLT